MRRFIRILLKLAVLAVCVVGLTAAWIILDGLHDSGHQMADVGLVFDHGDRAVDLAPVRRASELYHAGDYRAIIVSGIPDRVDWMLVELENNGVPAEAILVDKRGITMDQTARDVARTMEEYHFSSVLVVANYYEMTRMQLALAHAKVPTVEKVHVGAVRKGDAPAIGREVIALYDYLGTYYLLPEAKKVQQEAEQGAEKAKTEAEQAQKTVDQKLDSMSK